MLRVAACRTGRQVRLSVRGNTLSPERGRFGLDRRSFAIPLPLDAALSDDRGSPARVPPFSGAGRRRVRAGSLLMPEGRHPGSLLVFVTGVTALGLTGVEGRPSVIGLLGPGDVHGETCLHIAESPNVFPEVRTLTPCTVIDLSPHELHGHMARDPAVSVWLARSLARKVGDLQARLAATLALGVRNRTFAVLQILAERWGYPSGRGTVLELPLSQELLAALAGTSRESVNRALRDLRASGMVFRSGRRYVIQAPSARTDRTTGIPEPPRPLAPA
jgi:CRP/FNR family cyclic AMP-dependent transcriptional regulator